ncbi:Hypothetical predicted protein [Octopus vulgaris]|uniref:Uncharacterized protein n=1 Tax=Octopus vulgaris TaxID=6645 RepID=A0AA36BYH9_OCTVU|nr:Hypothetical predicted protein [Octopus vulgaris]
MRSLPGIFLVQKSSFPNVEVWFHNPGNNYLSCRSPLDFTLYCDESPVRCDDTDSRSHDSEGFDRKLKLVYNPQKK